MLLMLNTGCEELSSRRKIQKANKLYEKGKYSKAIELYEEALATTPSLDIGHHNAGLAYFKLFRPGIKKADNVALATKATEHFITYLKKNPKDATIIGLMTRLWMDSGQYKKALAYWKGQLAKDPKNIEVIQILASINRQAGQWEKAVEWHYKQADAETAKAGKIDAYVSVAKLVWHKLANPQKLLGVERLRVADIGLAALQRAEKIGPDDLGVHNYLASIYHFRGLTHGTAWARNVDEASAQFHRAIATKLRKAMEEKQKQEQKQGGGDKGAKDGKKGAAPEKTAKGG
jgi:tetratricopeptide (TPR) repeat protein